MPFTAEIKSWTYLYSLERLMLWAYIRGAYIREDLFMKGNCVCRMHDLIQVGF